MRLKSRKSVTVSTPGPTGSTGSAGQVAKLQNQSAPIAEHAEVLPLDHRPPSIPSIVGCADLSSAIKLSNFAKFEDKACVTTQKPGDSKKKSLNAKENGNEQLESILKLPDENKLGITSIKKRGSKILRSASFALGTKTSSTCSSDHGDVSSSKKSKLSSFLGGPKGTCYFGMGGKVMKKFSLGGRLTRRNALTPIDNTPEANADTLTKDAGSTPQNRYRLVPLNPAGVVTRSATKKRQSLSKSFNALNISAASSGDTMFNITAPAASVLDVTAYTLDSYVRSPDCIADLTLTSEFFLTPENGVSNHATSRKRSMENLTLFELPEKISFEMPEKLSPLEVDQLLQSWPPVVLEGLEPPSKVNKSVNLSHISETSQSDSQTQPEANTAPQETNLDDSPVAPCRSYLDYVKACEAKTEAPVSKNPRSFARRAPRMGVLSKVVPFTSVSFTEGVTSNIMMTPKASGLQKTPNSKSACKRKASFSPKLDRSFLPSAKKKCQVEKASLSLTPQSNHKKSAKSPHAASRTPRSAHGFANIRSPQATCLRRTPGSVSSRASPRVKMRSNSAKLLGIKSPAQNSVRTPRSAGRRKARSPSISQRTPRSRSASCSRRSCSSGVEKSQGKRVKIARRESIIIRERSTSALKKALRGVGQAQGETREEQKPALREYAGHTPKPPRKKEKIIFDERLI